MNNKPISTLDIINYHFEKLEDLLQDPIYFESKDEMVDYHHDILYHVIALKSLIDHTYR